MADAGLDVTAYDQRGFGASGGRRAWVDRFSDFHDDLEDRLAEARAASDGRPVALYGHSFGALVALGYVVADPPRPLPDALVLSAPALDDNLPRWQRAFARVMTRFAPTFEVQNAFDGTVLSRDPAVAERYLADPLNYHRSTIRLGALSFTEQDRVRAAVSRLSIPTLVYHGAADRLVPPSASERLSGLANVTSRTYPGLRHETHNEPEGEVVVADAIVWLHAALDGRAPRGAKVSDGVAATGTPP
jgi:alpha-beta hydrolase superfamily lysophospholipase